MDQSNDTKPRRSRRKHSYYYTLIFKSYIVARRSRVTGNASMPGGQQLLVQIHDSHRLQSSQHFGGTRVARLKILKIPFSSSSFNQIYSKNLELQPTKAA